MSGRAPAGPNARPGAQERARAVQLVALDVDGVLTDGAIVIGPAGEAMKRFSVHDGFGLRLLREAGLRLAVITARQSAIVEQRARELAIDLVLQSVADKAAALREVAGRFGLAPAQAAYMGDDWPDLGAMRSAGLAATVGGAPPEVLAAAHWVATRPAGAGAVREFATWLLDAQGRLEALRARYAAAG